MNRAFIILLLLAGALMALDLRYDPQTLDGAQRNKLGNEPLHVAGLVSRGDVTYDKTTGSVAVFGGLCHNVNEITNSLTTSVSLHPYSKLCESRYTTPSIASSNITVLVGGAYRVYAGSSIRGAINQIVYGHILTNSVDTGIGWHRKLNAAGDVGNANCSAILSLNSNDVVAVGLSADGSTSIIIEDAQFNLNKL